MNIFYEELPDYINVNGVPYKVITDFREWIRFSDMIASDIPTDLKAEFLMEMFLEDVPKMYSKQDMDAVIDGIVQFLTISELNFPIPEESKPDQNGQKRKLFITNMMHHVSYQLFGRTTELISWTLNTCIGGNLKCCLMESLKTGRLRNESIIGQLMCDRSKTGKK